MNVEKTITYRGYHIDIVLDTSPIEPDWDEPGEEVMQAWRDGEVYGFIIRETEDSVWGFYGWDDAISPDGGLMDYATNSIDCTITERSDALASLDLFDAASYPEPTLYDVAGAYQARLNEGMEAIGAATRKLEKEGYFNPGIIAIG